MMLLARSKNLTPQPPSLRGKGGPESPFSLRGKGGPESPFSLRGKGAAESPFSLRGKGAAESPSPLLLGVGEGSDLVEVTLPTASFNPWLVRTTDKDAAKYDFISLLPNIANKFDNTTASVFGDDRSFPAITG